MWSGSHLQLLAKQGRYAALWERQQRSGDEEDNEEADSDESTDPAGDPDEEKANSTP